MTPEQHATTTQVFEYIRAYVGTRGYAPSLREIAAGCYISRATVQRHLDLLEAWGCINRQPHTARGITILKAPGKRS